METVNLINFFPADSGDAAGDFHAALDVADGEKFTVADVESVVSAGMEWGDYAETTCVGIFRLKDGRFGYVSAGCDTTGWDCQAGGVIGIAASVEEARSHLTPDDLAIMDAGKLVDP